MKILNLFEIKTGRKTKKMNVQYFNSLTNVFRCAQRLYFDLFNNDFHAHLLQLNVIINSLESINIAPNLAYGIRRKRRKKKKKKRPPSSSDFMTSTDLQTWLPDFSCLMNKI